MHHTPPFTSSSRGIRPVIANGLAHHGTNVVANDSTTAGSAEKVTEKIRSHGVKDITMEADIQSEQEIQYLCQCAIAVLGQLDTVLRNCGIEYFAAHPDVTSSGIDEVFAVNLIAQYFADYGRPTFLTCTI
ncbi:hypothetical protein BDV38DRAFT_284842 [Aspergillus pseudotamarii]|uniref:3-oxoacyl-[acyl-carrier-protein] reductase n=1 Tax=Aspergillus pseudotamarii TaxID=132259 RepID=A0A5N6SQE1_ASPPS|nr:uncharacterized protein BDV38DRAFT_284842 [Aspergillus pseudotamarii]KAE8135583.1 hypothetical protein BDV38DRAFT_284842 [Aspergillus pseudotamarii]